MRNRLAVLVMLPALAGCGGSDGAPGADLTCTTRDQPTKTVKIHSEITSHANNSVLGHVIDFGDGSAFLNSKVPETHTYASAGDYEVTLVAIDRGKTGTDTCSLSIK